MIGNGTLKRLDARLTELEAVAEPEFTREENLWPWIHGERLKALAFALLHPDQANLLAAVPLPWVWYLWHFVRYEAHSPATSWTGPGPHTKLSRHLSAALRAWVTDLFAALWYEPPAAFPKWFPLNGAALHWRKNVIRQTYPAAVPTLGRLDDVWIDAAPLSTAGPIDQFFPGDLRPWSKQFDADPATWPPGLVEAVRGSGSLCPDPVPVEFFDWRSIVRSWNGCGGDEHPFPRDDDGQPIPGHFRGREEGEPCEAD